MTKITYNERSWAIDIITEINLFTSKNDKTIYRAGGETTINTGEKRLFETEPSGALAEYKAVAIGKNKKEAMKILEAGFKDNMSKKEAVHLMVTALKASATENEKFDLNKVDFAFIEQGTSLKRLAKEELVNFTSNKK